MAKIIVIGGGAAGMMAAIQAAEAGAQVEIWERNKVLGKKLAITGKGRCNLTNACSPEEVIKNMPGNGMFLYSALFAFSPEDTMDFFANLGVQLKVERGRRVFPASDDAKQIVSALQKRLQELGVKIIYGRRVRNLKIEDKRLVGIFSDDGLTPAACAIVATGGKSYAATGSSGDGYLWAKEAGHSIRHLRPSLVPLETMEDWPSRLSGLSLKNVRVTATTVTGEKENIIGQEFGEMLFTHFGLSGPVILTLSHGICAHLPGQEVKIYINLKPALSREQLEARMQRDLDKFSRKHLQNSLGDLLPASLIGVIVQLSGIDPHKECNQINKKERETLVDILQSLPLTVKGPRPIEEAIITAGGVNVKEVNPKTMQSKLVEGLYFAGEVLDIDGLTGGYNLQAAFATGAAAGKAAADLVLSRENCRKND
jgi:predicted Rossmann fold flavoprotein